jgi:hypothetical protein
VVCRPLALKRALDNLVMNAASHAARIELPHPDDGRALRVDAPPGDAWLRLPGGAERGPPVASGVDPERG